MRIDERDPRVRIAIVIMMSLLCFVLREWVTIVTALAIALMLWRSVRLGFDDLVTGLKPLRVVFVLVIAAQAIFYPGETPLVLAVPRIGTITLPVTVEGFAFGIMLCLRVLVLACTVPIVTARTSIDRIVLALTKLGLPYRAAYTVTTAMNQIPVLTADIATICEAQRLRGSVAFGPGGRLIQKLNAYPALVVPLVMTSMRRANLMGVAMHSRAFGSGTTRTSIHTLAFGRMDAFVLAASVVVFALLIAIDRVV